MTTIPLVDLAAQYQAYKDEFDAAISRCVVASSYIGGPDHESFAKEFAAFCGGGHAALCGNGTSALYLAVMELLGPGDGHGEIITVSHTFIATAEAITQAGYRPVFVDVRPDTCLMDVSKIEEALTPSTKAILPVHLYGQMVPMDALMDVAREHDLLVIEDGAQAHGAAWKGKGPGQWGDAACFSFYPGKNLGAWGDGGAVLSRNQEVIERIRMRADHGRTAKYKHEFVGINSRLDGLQAAILRVKLRHLADWNEQRRQVASRYGESLHEADGVELPTILDEAEHVFHLYAIQVEDRDRVYAEICESGVGAGIHYPIPVHEQPAYAHLGITPESLLVTHNIARRVLSLPIYPEMIPEQVEAVATAVRNAVQHTGHGLS